MVKRFISAPFLANLCLTWLCAIVSRSVGHDGDNLERIREIVYGIQVTISHLIGHFPLTTSPIRCRVRITQSIAKCRRFSMSESESGRVRL